MNHDTSAPYEDTLRSRLLAEASRLADRYGVQGATVSRIASAAGVTKGGLLYHFPSKSALFAGMMQADLAILDRDIASRLQPFPLGAKGRYTCAYAGSILDHPALPHDPWSSVFRTMSLCPAERPTFTDWRARALESHRLTDDGVQLGQVRLAIDGMLMARITKNPSWDPVRLRRLLQHMIGSELSEDIPL